MQLLLGLLVAPCAALSVGMASSARPVMSPAVAARSARRAAAPDMSLGALKYAAAFPALYGLMSVNEYCTHRWYQHAEFNKEAWMQNVACFLLRKKEYKIRGGGHVEHHAETYDDMTLKKDERWARSPAAKSLDSDVFRGTAFTWKTTGLMTFQMLWSTIPVFRLLGFGLGGTFAFLLPGMLLHALVWNMLHPPMHGLSDVPLSVGAPSTWLAGLRNTRYFRCIYENHQGHHVLGGKCNYNVCCPGTDHLIGTYVPTSAWQPQMRAVPPMGAVERWGTAVEPFGVPQAPIDEVRYAPA
jgi:hypothetical protein